MPSIPPTAGSCGVRRSFTELFYNAVAWLREFGVVKEALGLDVRELKALCGVFDAGSLSKASEGLFVTRQALGKMIRKLEEETGAPLFVRSAGGVQPTRLAQAIEPHARRILDELDAIEADVRKYREGLSGSFILAIEPNAVMTLPTGVVGAYREVRPGLVFDCVTVTGRASLSELISGSVDAVLSIPLGNDSFVYAPLLTSRLCAVFRLTKKEGTIEPPKNGHFPLSFLDGKTLFGVARDHPIEAEILAYLDGNGVHAKISYDYPSASLAMGAMLDGLGGCLIEEGGANLLSDETYIKVPFEGKDAPVWKVGVTSRRGTSKRTIIDDFVSFVRGRVEGMQLL